MKLHWNWHPINKRMIQGHAEHYVAHLTDHGDRWHWAVYDNRRQRSHAAYLGTAVNRNMAQAAAELQAYNDYHNIGQPLGGCPLGEARQTKATWPQLTLLPEQDGSSSSALALSHPAKP